MPTLQAAIIGCTTQQAMTTSTVETVVLNDVVRSVRAAVANIRSRWGPSVQIMIGLSHAGIGKSASGLHEGPGLCPADKERSRVITRCLRCFMTCARQCAQSCARVADLQATLIRFRLQPWTPSWPPPFRSST
jgi:hypothetical protein